MSVYLRQYGAAATIRFTLRQADSNAFATNSHWTPATGDVKLSAGGGALADSTNLPTYVNGRWSLSLTAGEMAADPLEVSIEDAAIIPEDIIVETFGDASATYPTSYGDQWLGIATKITADHGAGSYVDTGPGLDAVGVRTAVGLASANLDTQLAAIPTVAPLDATATEAAALAALVSHGVLTTGGDVNLVSVAGVAVGGVADFKADVSGLLTAAAFAAALPTNFGVLSIDTSGNVTTTGGGALTPEQATWIEETHAKAMLIGTGGAVVQVPIDSDLNVTVRSYRDYDATDGLAIEWANTGGTWPDLTGATVVVRVAKPGCKSKGLYDFAASVVTPTGSQLVRLELTDEQLSIIADDYTYELVATLTSDNVVTIADGQFRVILGRQAP